MEMCKICPNPLIAGHDHPHDCMLSSDGKRCLRCQMPPHGHGFDTPRQLRAMDCITDGPIMDLPVVFVGTIAKCFQFARDCGYTWKKDQNIFGGYFVKQPDGNCLFIT